MKNRLQRSLCGIAAITLFSASISYGQQSVLLRARAKPAYLGDGGGYTGNYDGAHGLTLDGAGNL